MQCKNDHHNAIRSVRIRMMMQRALRSCVAARAMPLARSLSTTTQIPPFHLAIPVHDLSEGEAASQLMD